MIFCLGDDVLQELAETEIQLEYDSFLSKELINLIESDHNCLLAESSQILKLYSAVIKNKNVSNDMKKIIRYCFRSYTTMFSLTLQVNQKIIISKKMEKQRDIYITPEYLMRHKLKLENATALLSEDLTDCEFYEQISKKLIRVNGVSILFRHVAGAGKNIYKELKKSATHNRDFVYAICDSDKYYPDCEIGDTAKYLEEGAEELHGQGIIHMDYEILEVSEKENLIKPTEYKNFYRPNSLLNSYLDIEKNQDMSKYLTYLDFKSGLKKSVFYKSREYYSDLLTTYDSFGKELDKLEDNSAILNGLGRVCMNNFTSQHLEEGTTDLDLYRKKIAKNIFTWGISVGERKVI